MIPAWKLKREWNRLVMQASQWHWFLFAGLRRRRHDIHKTFAMKVTEGAVAPAPNMAILLIYQPDTVLGSTYDTLDHFRDKGVSPVVVSNTSLSAADEARLAEKAHLVIQRPNYGYDFGGYRDAVLALKSRKIHLDNLFIVNDSIWFPIWPDCDLIDRALANPSDLFGIFYNDREGHEHRSHLQSYFFRFGPKVLQSRDFLTFWRRIMLTNNKHMVIRQCEMKLTHYFTSRGYSRDQLYDLTTLKAATKALPDDQLREALEYHALVETRSAPEIARILADTSGNWRTRAEQMIDGEKVAKYYLIAHPHTLFGQMKSPMIKKDKQPIYSFQRGEMVRLGYDKDMRPIVAEEVRHRIGDASQLPR